MGHRSHRNEWRTVSGPHALVFLEANQPRQSLVDPGINHGFEPDYGFETGRRGPAATGTRRLAGPRREAQDELGCGERPALGRTSGLDMCCAARGPSSPRPYCSKATILGSLEPKELARIGSGA